MNPCNPSLPPSSKAMQSANENTPEILEMDSLLTFLEKKGRALFGEQFKIQRQDYDLIFRMLVYFYRDQQHADESGIKFRKGLMLNGPVGCGKTSLMSLFRYLSFPGHKYQVVSARDVCIQFMEQGHQVIKYYASIGMKSPMVFCFDDLGSETSMKYYGNEVNVMGEILLSRYELYTQRGIPTHITTNLSASELEKVYGNRLRSRMREMFNLIAFPGTAPDKRC